MSHQSSPSYTFRTVMVPLVLVVDAAVTNYVTSHVSFSAQQLTDLNPCCTPRTVLHGINALNLSSFDFSSLPDSQRNFLIKDVDYCTVRTIDLSHSVGCDSFVFQLLSCNQTLRSLTLLSFNGSDVQMRSLLSLLSNLSFDGPLIRDYQLLRAESDATARICVDVKDTPAALSVQSHMDAFSRPHPTPVGVRYVHSEAVDLTAQLFITLQVSA